MYKEHLNQNKDELQQTNTDYRAQLRQINEGFESKVKKIQA